MGEGGGGGGGGGGPPSDVGAGIGWKKGEKRRGRDQGAAYAPMLVLAPPVPAPSPPTVYRSAEQRRFQPSASNASAGPPWNRSVGKIVSKSTSVQSSIRMPPFWNTIPSPDSTTRVVPMIARSPVTKLKSIWIERRYAAAFVGSPAL